MFFNLQLNCCQLNSLNHDCADAKKKKEFDPKKKKK